VARELQLVLGGSTCETTYETVARATACEMGREDGVAAACAGLQQFTETP
jgi:hypothetical protein